MKIHISLFIVECIKSWLMISKSVFRLRRLLYRLFKYFSFFLFAAAYLVHRLTHHYDDRSHQVIQRRTVMMSSRHFYFVSLEHREFKLPTIDIKSMSPIKSKYLVWHFALFFSSFCLFNRLSMKSNKNNVKYEHIIGFKLIFFIKNWSWKCSFGAKSACRKPRKG